MNIGFWDGDDFAKYGQKLARRWVKNCFSYQVFNTEVGWVILEFKGGVHSTPTQTPPHPPMSMNQLDKTTVDV